MSENDKTLVYDLKLYSATQRIGQNILSVRTASSAPNAYIKEDSFTLLQYKSMVLETLENTSSFCLYSTQPVDVELIVDNNIDPIILLGQTMTVITSNVESVTVANPNKKTASVTVARLAGILEAVPDVPDILPRTLVTFAFLSRITELPQDIVNIDNVIVEDVTLFVFTNNQSQSTGTGAAYKNLFRICDADGTPNDNGRYLMLLDDDVTQQNFSGTLQFWITEKGA